LAKRAGFNPDTQLVDTLYRNVGDTGTAQVFLSLVSALSKAKPGERLLVVGYGDGAEAILLTVTDNIQKAAACRGRSPISC
jgi:3-hydroxy-3-methylglutaryl CoA synthase